jgi:hypothetical protein
MITDKEYQIQNLSRIFNDGALSPVFKENPKYPVNGVPRISYDDVMDYKFIIRNDKDFSSNSFWSEDDVEMIFDYKNIEELVDDGWRLD